MTEPVTPDRFTATRDDLITLVVEHVRKHLADTLPPSAGPHTIDMVLTSGAQTAAGWPSYEIALAIKPEQG